MNKKNCIIIFISISLTGCLNDNNICPSTINPTVNIQNFQQLTDKDETSLLMIDKDRKMVLNYDLKYIKSFEDYTVVYFDKKESIIPSSIYEIQYNNDIYFIHNIKIANNTKYRYCSDETTYKVNDCQSQGYILDIDSSCAIPADQASSYFEKKVKPTM